MPHVQLRQVTVRHRVYDAGSRSITARIAVTLRSPNGRNSFVREAMTVDALSDINLDIESGERIAILGANSAGKTTLLRVATGLLEPTTGAAEITGVASDILDGGIGLDGDVSGHEYVVMQGLRRGLNRREIRQIASSVFEFCGSPNWFGQRLRAMTHGQQFSIQAATSLQIGDDIIVLDEIVEAADAEFTMKLVNYIQHELPSTTILVVAERIRSFIEAVCSKGLVLDAGRVVDFDHLDRILLQYGDSYTV